VGEHARETAPRPSWRVELAIVAGVLIVFVALIGPTLDHPLLERHDFRQTQTAFTARIFHEEGIDLLHPRVPVLGAPFEIPFEFPLHQAAASLVMDLGVAEDTAMRVTTLFCFLATALLLYGLVRHIAGRTAAIGSLVAFVVTPLAVVWSRASTIEYMATAGAVGFTWAFIVWRDRRQPIVGVLCLLAGLVAMLVKPTTAVFWLIPAVAYRPTGPNRIAMRRDPGLPDSWSSPSSRRRLGHFMPTRSRDRRRRRGDSRAVRCAAGTSGRRANTSTPTSGIRSARRTWSF
jgi:Dolichyl-phosphate-mannose-protein mannosyltransferase